MRIAFIGTGYVGLVSGTCLAEFGHSVVCVDNDQAKVDGLRLGEIPIYEPGLDALVARNTAAGNLVFETDLARAVAQSEVVFIAVGTPSDKDGAADVSAVLAVARDIGAAINGYTVVVIKSTVPVGTGDAVAAILSDVSTPENFSVVSNPEFLREGAAIDDFMAPDRVVVGSDEDRALAVMREVYHPLFVKDVPLVSTSRRTAELTKYAGNSFLATKITFINEMADLCEKVGADVQDLARGIGLDKRIGGLFLQAGPGYGGSCFPKDMLALIRTAEDAGAPARVISTVVAVNEGRKRQMAQKIIDACGGTVKGKTICVLGVTFRPDTDDVRGSTSLEIIPVLKSAGAEVQVYDPQGMAEARGILGEDIRWCGDAYEAVDGAVALSIVTEWDAFRMLDLKRIKGLMDEPRIIDFRNIFEPAHMAAAGFDYHCVGRGAA